MMREDSVIFEDFHERGTLLTLLPLLPTSSPSTSPTTAVASSFYRGSAGVVIVFDITSRESFNGVDFWINDVRQNVHDDNIPILLVGNKCDLTDLRQISTEEGKKKAASIGCSYLETSAKTAENVDEAFLILLEYITSKGEKTLENGENSPLAFEIPSPTVSRGSESAHTPSKQSETIKLGDNPSHPDAAQGGKGCAC